MNIIWIILIITAFSVVLFILADYLMKKCAVPQTAERFIWNAVYFIQIKQYDKALSLLDQMEQTVAITPEEMCQACVQRADANKALGQMEQATDAYERLYEALLNCEGPKRKNEELLKEIQSCYQACQKDDLFIKWEQLFDNEKDAEE